MKDKSKYNPNGSQFGIWCSKGTAGVIFDVESISGRIHMDQHYDRGYERYQPSYDLLHGH